MHKWTRTEMSCETDQSLVSALCNPPHMHTEGEDEHRTPAMLRLRDEQQQ